MNHKQRYKNDIMKKKRQQKDEIKKWNNSGAADRIIDSVRAKSKSEIKKEDLPF